MLHTSPNLSNDLGGGGRPVEPKNEGKLTDIVPVVVFTAFGIEEARELAKRLRNTIHPVDSPPPGKSAQAPSSTQASSSKSASKKRQTQQESKPDRLPDLVAEPEDSLPDRDDIRSGDDIFLNMSAVDLSYYMSAQHDDLVRGVAISLRHEKFILSYLEDPLEYLKHFAEYGWDEESDEEAEKFIQWYVERFRPELERQREYSWSLDALSGLEYWIREVANDERESVIVYDLEAGETLFVRYGDRDSVTMQTLHQKLAEGRNIVVIHNHPNNSGASLADLSAAAWLDAEYMMIVNPDGTVHRHQRIGDNMVELEPIHNPDYVAPADPQETAMDSIAYWIQSLREIGNPPEAVFEQGEALWWQEGNIIVPYHTDETIEEVAIRMGIPTKHLQKLNERNTETDRMYIPLPGWYTQMIDGPNDSSVSVAHSTGATFLNLEHRLEKDQLISQWNSLSPVEQQIEIALTGSHANVDTLVQFDNAGYDFDYTVEWIQRHETTIHQAATDFQIPVALLNTVLASELLYDYGNIDQLQDDIIRANFNLLARQLLWRDERIRDSWDGAGVANVHYPTLIDAYHYVAKHLEPGETHPWKLDPDAPDLESAPKLKASDEEKTKYVELWADYYDHRPFDDLDVREQEVALFWIRADKLDEVPRDLRVEIAHYLAEDSGSARAAAMISQMYGGQLGELDGGANILENPRDIARIWGRYRSADEYFDYLGNARLAYPIAEYWSKQ